MGKKKKKKKVKGKRKQTPDPSTAPSFMWTDNGEMHGLIPGERPSDEQIEIMTRKYQEEIRKSPIWDEVVKEYGKEKAEEWLKECRIRVE
jgi:hypothetical protein